MMLSAKIVSGLGLSNDPDQYVLTPRTAQKYKIVNKKYEDILYKNPPPPPFGPPGSSADLFPPQMRPGRVKMEGEGREEEPDPAQYVLSPRTAQKYEAMFKQSPYGQGPADMFPPQVLFFPFPSFPCLSLEVWGENGRDTRGVTIRNRTCSRRARRKSTRRCSSNLHSARVPLIRFAFLFLFLFSFPSLSGSLFFFSIGKESEKESKGKRGR